MAKVHDPIVVYAADLKSKLLINFKKNKANSKKIYYFGKDIENHNDCGSRLVFMRFVSYSRY
jgi:hypothetical protein